MPVVGPGDNKENADQAYEEILQLIREKYHVRYDKLLHKKMYKEDMRAELTKLQETIRTIFRLDSWDSW